MPDRAISLRLSVVNSEGARVQLTRLGDAGEVALERIAKQAPRTSAALNQVDRDITRASGSIRSGLGQVGFQIQDVFVQIQAGTDPVRALTQQVSQLAGAFGPVGIAIGTVVAVGGSLITMLTDSEAAAEAATAAQERLDATLVEQGDTVEDVARKFLGLNAVQRTLAQLEIAEDIRTWRKELQETGEAAREAAEDLQTFTVLAPSEAGLRGTSEQIAQLHQLIEDLDAGRVSAAQAAVEMDRLATAIGDPRVREAADLVRAHAQAQEELGEQIKFGEEAQRLFASMTDESARALIEQGKAADATGAKIEDLTQTLRTNAEADRRLRQQRSQTAQGQEATEAAKRAAQAAQAASRDAERQAERDAQFRRKKAQDLATELERISEQTIARGNAARVQAQEESAREIERDLQRQSDEQAKAMLVPYEDASPEAQQATANEFARVYR